MSASSRSTFGTLLEQLHWSVVLFALDCLELFCPSSGVLPCGKVTSARSAQKDTDFNQSKRVVTSLVAFCDAMCLD